LTQLSHPRTLARFLSGANARYVPSTVSHPIALAHTSRFRLLTRAMWTRRPRCLAMRVSWAACGPSFH
jgi:hypothetical protein